MRPIVLSGLLLAALPSAASTLEEVFARPPRHARPQTWWHWVNNCVNPAAMRVELAAMADAGLGGVHLFNAGYAASMPDWPATPFLSEAWKDALRTALAACRDHGLDFTAQNGAGWSGSGGPWIAPSNGMLQVRCAEVRVAGGQEAVLPRPDPSEWPLAFPAKAPRWYGDVAALAFPVPEACLSEETNLVRSVKVRWRREKGKRARVRASDDGRRWRTVAELDAGEALYEYENDAVDYALPPVRDRHVRVKADEGAVVSAEFSSRPVLGNLSGKTAAKAVSIPLGEAISEEGGAAVDARDVRILGPEAVDADGALRWRPPADGRTWALLRVGRCTTGRVNDPSPDGAAGPVGDLMDADVTRRHLDAYFRQVLDVGRAVGGACVKGLLLDSWESGTQNWAHDLPQEFRRRRGYDLTPWLPVYAGYLVDSRDASERFLFDVRKTLDELLRERYFGVVADFCRAHGLEQSVEGFACGVGTFAGDPMTPYLACDVPMSEGGQVREAPSAAHLNGGALVACEAHTSAADWSLAPRDLKAAEDGWFLKGVTRTVIHTYAHNAFPERRYPGPAFGGFGFCLQLGQAWWPHVRPWTEYLSRCQAMLTRGRFAADVLAFTGEDRTGPLAGFYGGTDRLKGLPPGYDYDHVPGGWLVESLEAAPDGTLGGPRTGRYRLLVLRDCDTALTVEVARKVRTLVADGGAVLGPKPRRSLGDLPRARQNDAEVAAIADEVWGDCDGRRVKSRAYGKGRVFAGMTPGEALAALGVRPDFAARGLRVGEEVAALHRREGDADIYFVVRKARAPAGSEMGFRVTGKRPRVFDPLTGRIVPARAWRVADGHTWLPMVEGDAEEASRFVVFDGPADSAASAGAGEGNEGARAALADVNGPWQVEFDGLGFRRTVSADGLFDWSKQEDPEIAHYSGVAAYRTRLRVPDAVRDGRMVLSLGRVDVSAEVLVDGVSAGIAWCEPYEVDVTEAVSGKRGQTVGLEIRVANTWRNRLIADEALPPGLRKTWTSASNLKKGDPLAPSGLLGPVRLLSVERVAGERAGTDGAAAFRGFELTGAAEHPGFVAEGVACVFPVNLKEGERLLCGLDGRWRLHDRAGVVRAEGRLAVRPPQTADCRAVAVNAPPGRLPRLRVCLGEVKGNAQESKKNAQESKGKNEQR